MRWVVGAALPSVVTMGPLMVVAVAVVVRSSVSASRSLRRRRRQSRLGRLCWVLLPTVAGEVMVIEPGLEAGGGQRLAAVAVAQAARTARRKTEEVEPGRLVMVARRQAHLVFGRWVVEAVSSRQGVVGASWKRSIRDEVRLIFSGSPSTGARAGLVLHVLGWRELRQAVVGEQRRQAASARTFVMILDRIGRMSRGLLYSTYTLDPCHRTHPFSAADLPPVSTPPPVFRNLGIPPANKPASCGALSIAAAEGAPGVPWSLLLLALFPGMGGARPPGGFAMPGTGGAPPSGDGPGPPDTFPTIGADRSFVTAFLRALPLLMSARRAPYSSNDD